MRTDTRSVSGPPINRGRCGPIAGPPFSHSKWMSTDTQPTDAVDRSHFFAVLSVLEFSRSNEKKQAVAQRSACHQKFIISRQK